MGLVTACFPCTDLSLAGGRRGIEAGPQSSSFLRFADMLDHQKSKRPPFVILENVVALIHSHAGKDFRIVLDRLAGAGYRVDALRVDARHFVPQSRPRLFIVGVRDDVDLGPYQSARELEAPDVLRPERLYDFMQANADLPWAIRPLPGPADVGPTSRRHPGKR